jgi:O-methyltransferase domain
MPGRPAAWALGEHLGIPQATQPFRVLDLSPAPGDWGGVLAEQSPLVELATAMAPGETETGYDLAVLGHALHRAGEARARALLRDVRAALRPGGTVAVAEIFVAPRRTEPALALVLAADRVLHTEAGDAYSFEETAEWLLDAGFAEVRPLEVPGPAPLALAGRSY